MTDPAIQRSVLAVAPHQAFAQEVADALDNVEVVHARSLAVAFEAVSERPGSVTLIGPDIDFDEAVDFALDVRGLTGVVLVARGPTTPMMRRAMRADVADVLSSSWEVEELVEAVQRAWPTPATADAPPLTKPTRAGNVVTIFAAKGGCGKSTVATNLATVLVQRGRTACVLDLDLQFGDAAIMFQLRPTLTIQDAVQVIDELDEGLITDFVTRHESGVGVLSAPLKPSQADSVRASHIAPLLDLLRARYDHVIVDTPSMFTDVVLAAIDESDRVVVIGGFDVPSIKNLRLGLTTIHQLGVESEVIDVVMARANAKVGLRLKEVERTIGATIDIAIPSERDVTVSLNHGVPLAIEKPKSPVVAAIEQLADRILGVETPTSDGTAESAVRRALPGRRRATAPGTSP